MAAISEDPEASGSSFKMMPPKPNINRHDTLDRNLFLRWVRATWAGWLLGIPFIIILALIGEAIGIGGSQFLVGAGMGTGTGLLQSRVIRAVTHNALPWFWSSAVGLGFHFSWQTSRM